MKAHVAVLVGASLLQPANNELKGNLKVGQPSAEYHFASSDGKLVNSEKRVGYFLQSGEIILRYKVEGGVVKSLQAIDDGYLEKLHSENEISRGELLAKLRSEVVFGKFELDEPLMIDGIQLQEDLWLCNGEDSLKVEVHHVGESSLSISIKLKSQNYSNINNKQVTLFKEKSDCGA